MKITLKMEIMDHEENLEVNLTNRAGRIYRQQYRRDIIRDMSDLYKKLNKSPFDGIDMTGINFRDDTEEEIYAQLIQRVDPTKLMENLQTEQSLDFEEIERAGQIIWAFVKNYDEKTPDYEEWIDGFDFILPVEKILSALYEAWGKSAQPTLELKN